MNTKRNALLMGILFVLLFTSACGGAAATQVPITSDPYQDYSAPAATEAPAGTYAPSVNEAQAPSIANSGAPNQKSDDEPEDMFFQNYGVNPSIDTDDDNLYRHA